MKQLTGYLRLARPANMVTAVSDILAGVAIAGFVYELSHNKPLPLTTAPLLLSVILLVVSTIGLYGGGVVMNDVFDAALDKKERPERPIPSGLIKKKWASVFGIALLLAGILTAAFVNTAAPVRLPALVAMAIATAALVYDKWSKHHAVAGPLNMGLCRGLNLFLGMSIFPAAMPHFWWLGLVPVLYIAAITMISRGEVHGGKRITLYIAAALYNLVIAAILLISLFNETLLFSLGFIVLFCLLIFPSLQKAILHPEGPQIGKAVKSGVIALIAMNAAWAATFGNLFMALLILLLLPLSLVLARLFAVT